MDKKLYEFCVEGEKFFFNGRTYQIFQGKKEQFIDDATSTIQLTGKTARLGTLALTITNNCNMGCSYCYAGQGAWDLPGHIMSDRIAFKAVDLLLESVKKSLEPFATLTFFGGEPLLRFNFIKKVVNYAENKSNGQVKLRFALVTNGTLLTEEIILFLKSKKFVLSLSLDGDAKIHNKCRIFKNGMGTYNKVVLNGKKALSEIPVLIRATISNHNYNVVKDIQHINSLGFKRISYELDHSITEPNFIQFMNSSEALFDWYLNQIQLGSYFDFRNLTRVFATILTRRRSKSHCNAGVGYMCVSADGNLYPCHRFIGIKAFAKANLETLSLDELNRIVSEFNFSLKNGPVDRHQKCSSCQFDFLCGGACPYQAYVHTGKLLEVYERGCQYKRIFFDQSLRLLSELKKEELRKFIIFLVQIWQEESGTKEFFSCRL